ncbi:MAG: hypothetical protein A2152_00585 [Candidatus Levybacteria bacterium RBG_16_35_6]|nr:MAG: hypothetical protein A2152_00585 [Candidatus Levybacteria bacterium RBG_16_35_6]
MNKNNNLGTSFYCAFKGIGFALKYNRNLRVHFLIAFLVIILSIFFRVNAFEMGILGVMILVVISSEMINTSIEEMTDLITKEHREEARIAKDVSAGMVLLSTIGSIVVGILIFVPHILRLIR